MGLLSFFQRQPDAEAPAPAPAPAEPDAVAAARARARRRLLGATVLLGLGVIGFPLLFETQPRPVAVDIPIDIPRKDSAAPLVVPPAALPSARAPAAVAEAVPAQPAVAGRASPPEAEIVERASDQGRELAPAAAATVRPGPGPEAKAAESRAADAKAADAKPAETKVADAKAALPPAPASRPASGPARGVAGDKPATDDGARAKALLEGQPAAAASAAGGRVVVQVGAYADAAKLAETRRKLEAMGFKTYTQVVDGEGGPRTRVRLGPFAGRAEADKAAARVKAAGLPAAILTL